MELQEFLKLDQEEKLGVSIEILDKVKNPFVESLLSQWKRGCNLSAKQRVHLFLLAEQQLTSIERGFTGIDHGVTNITEHKKPEIEKPQRKRNKIIRYKHKYRQGDIEMLLAAYELSCGRGINPDNGHQIGWIIGGDWYETLRDFVVWITDEDPSHPLAGGIEDYE